MSSTGSHASRVRDAGARLRQYAGVAAGALGVLGDRASAGPLHAQIGVCDPCNHRCVMCWDHPPEDRQSASTRDRFGGRAPGMMSYELFEGIVRDLHALGTRRVDLVGRGEPLLNPRVEDMVALASSLGMLVLLCSNASLLARERARKLVAAGLDRLNVSLNAGTEETYPRIHVTETPENYRRVKANLAGLAEERAARGGKRPHVRLSFVVSSRNYFEIERMVEVVREVGADEAMFVHTVVHEGVPDLALDEAQYAELLRLAERAQARAAELGVATNLGTFSATSPTYLGETMTGPSVVPCYVGWYFTNVLANGSVMPCCQCASPIDRVTADRSFREIWNSRAYGGFRRTARALPATTGDLAGCECDRCALRPRNLSLHNFLHPLRRIDGGAPEQLFRVSDLLRLKKVDRQ